MDLSADSGTLHIRTTVGGPELPLSGAGCQTESGGTILLNLLEFKTHLLEAVEELHIRRDAETRFEEQISKLVLEKQELEWEKESLQHQIETVANQHTESLINLKKQFQAKIRHTEEEKGKYQVSAELKDKEINNLKEELKSLQLLKYNLEKKSSELEQKLALQSRSKDSHLNQLGEVEKRFSALSRQCAMVKQAHEKLEQNVDEAMRRNKKLTSVNEKQEATIVSLKKELGEVSTKLIKAKMTTVRHDKTHSPTGREQRIQQLQQKLNMETEMNKKLEEENVAVRAEKQEMMRTQQHTQQLLLSQTQTVSRIELELQTQREQYQALKQEHEVMREKSKAMEDKVAQVMESYAASRTSWDKEKLMFLDHIKSEQQDLQAVKEAYHELHQKHTELSSQAEVQAQHIYELEVRDSSPSLSVSTQLFPTLVEEIRGEETLNEPISSSELPSFGSPQHLAFTQTRSPDCLEDTGAVTKLVATGVPGGQDTPNHHQRSQFKQPLNPSKPFACPLTKSESGSDVVTDLISTASSVSDDRLLISKGSCEKSNDENGAMSEKEQRREDGVKQGQNSREGEGRNEGQQWNSDELQGEDVKKGGNAGEKRGTLMAQTTDRADRQEDSQRSAEDARDTKQPQTETKDRVEREGTDGVEESGKTGLHMPETQIPAQTTADTTTEKIDARQVVDFMDTELPLAACETSDCSHSVSQKVSEKDADSSHASKAYESKREVHTLCSDEHRGVSHGPNSAIQECLCHDGVQTFAQDAESLNHLLHPDFEKATTEKNPSDKSAANILTGLTEPLNQSSICSSQTDPAPLATQSDNIFSVQELETPATHSTPQPGSPSDTSSMKQTDEMFDTHVSEECDRTLVQDISEQESGRLKSLVTDEDDDGDSSILKKRESQSNVDRRENDACETAQENSNLKDACVYITVDLESEVETGNCGEHTKNNKIEDSADLSHEDDTSPETGRENCYEQSRAKEMLLDDTNESSLPSNNTYRSSFDWGRKTLSSRSKSDVSALHQFVQVSPMPEQNISGPGGLHGHPPTTIPMFLKSKHNKVPLVITRASDLLNASSVSGTAASSRRHHQGQWKVMGEAGREAATADMESRASMSISSFPVSTPSITVSRLSWQTTPGCSRAPTSAAGPSAESHWETSCSQEREDQQSSFRDQISKIEQFLNTERLRLPKRRKTDN